MNICNAICEDPVPQCPVIAKIMKKTQLPAFDALGPFPDETIMSGVDRALFFLGARRVQEFLHLPTPSMDCCSSSECSFEVEQVPCPDEHKDCRSCSTIITPCKGTPRAVSVLKTCCCPKCQCCASRTTVIAKKAPCGGGGSCSCGSRSSKSSAVSRVKICEPPAVSCCGDMSSGMPSPKPPGALKRSFSLCSLACRKLKHMLTFQTGKENKPKWLWTRLQSHENGCEVYEIFKNSNVCTHPSQIESKTTPQIIFVVLQNGNIMPFEILACH